MHLQKGSSLVTFGGKRKIVRLNRKRIWGKIRVLGEPDNVVRRETSFVKTARVLRATSQTEHKRLIDHWRHVERKGDGWVEKKVETVHNWWGG